MSFGFRGRHGHRRHGGRTVTGQTGDQGRAATIPPRQCICPHCGMITDKVPGQPCFLTPCPRCQGMMAGRFPAEERREQSHEE